MYVPGRGLEVSKKKKNTHFLEAGEGLYKWWHSGRTFGPMAVGLGSVLRRPHWGFSARPGTKRAFEGKRRGPPRKPGVLFWGSGC